MSHDGKDGSNMTFIYEENHPENGPYCWEMPTVYKNYKTKLTTTTGEWQTPVVCPYCHTPLYPYSGCETCNERWIRNMYNDLGRKR